MTKVWSRIGAALLLAAGLCGQASAQPISENFDNFGSLAGNGWAMSNMSSPIGDLSWRQGDVLAIYSNSGAGSSIAMSNYRASAVTGTTNTISDWLMTPNRTFRNGDVFTFYTRTSSPVTHPDRLEVRLSTNGASTFVGNSATTTGDFSTLLLSINSSLNTTAYPVTWTQYTVTISGLPAPTSGRIGFRYFVTNGGAVAANAEVIGLDDFVYTPYVCPSFTVSPASGALPNGRAGEGYGQTLSQIGALGAPNYAITAGALPPGMTLSASGTISGTPTATGTFNFTVTVADNSGCSGSSPYTITVGAGTPPTPYGVSATAGDASAVVSWGSLEYDAYGVAMNGFTVTAVEDPTKTCSTNNGQATSCTVPGLTNGNSYSFRVTVSSAGGTSSPAITNSVTPRATQSIDFPQPAPQQYAGLLTPQATASSGLPVSFSIDSGPCQMQMSGQILFVGTGLCGIRASQAGDGATLAAPDALRYVVVGKADQVITFTSTAPANAHVNDSYQVAATGGTSNIAVIFSIDPASAAVCSVAGNNVSFNATGNCTIRADQGGNLVYNAAQTVQQVVTVTQATQSIDFPQPAAQRFGGLLTPLATATSNLTVSFAIDSGACQQLMSGHIEFTGVGSCVVRASQAGNVAFTAAPDVVRTIVVNKAEQIITFTSLLPANARVGGTHVVSATGGASGNAVTFAIDNASAAVCSIAGSTVSLDAAGNCTIRAAQAGNALYDDAAPAQQVVAIAMGGSAVSISSGANPSLPNQLVTFTISVTQTAVAARGAAAAVPTGTVQLMEGSTLRGTATLVNGVATITVLPGFSGSHSFTAIYSGDANFPSAQSTAFAQVVLLDEAIAVPALDSLWLLLLAALIAGVAMAGRRRSATH